MGYLLQQIFWFVLVAFVLGLLAGWLAARGRGAKEDPEAQRRIAELEAEANRLRAEIAALKEPARGTPIEDIEGIGTGFGKRLRAEGIATTEKLLELCATDDGVRRVCNCVAVDEATVRNWGTMADLMRIRGLGGQWSELLWRSGVASVQDLASCDAATLAARMAEVNEAEHRVAELPGEQRVKQFIGEAATLQPVLPKRQAS
jgi:predicted flap endonuclease-1-like 5' DNA nuclease